MAAPLQKTATPGIYCREGPKGRRYVHVWRHRGRQHRKTFRTLGEARNHKAQTGTGASKPTARTYFEDYACSWIASYRGRTSRGFSDSSRAEYRRALTTHAIPYFERFRLDEIAPQDVRSFFGALEKEGVSAAGIRKVRAPLSALFATALEDGLVRSNPVTGVRIIAPRDEDPTTTRRALTRRELGELLAAIPEHERLPFELLVHTGLRAGELVALRWGDVEFGEKVRVHVRSKIYQGKRGQPKSDAAARTIPLSPKIARRLWVLRSASEYRGDESPVFASRVGTPLWPTNLNRRFLIPAREAVGLNWVTLHSLRHTCASLLFEAGRNVKQVQAWLGHSDPSFTLRTYVHLMDEGVGDADFLDEAAAVSNGTTKETAEVQPAAASSLPVAAPGP